MSSATPDLFDRLANGHVFKRIIKGGPINNPKQERGFLVYPGDFIIDTVKNVGGRAAGALIPIS
jgi:hypothetical protein